MTHEPPATNAHERAAGPVIVIGVDALDVDLMRGWVDGGRLPFLKGLLERGSFARLDSTKCMFGDAPWPSLNSGVSPARHGFYNHLQLTRGTLDIKRIDARDLRVLPFWHHLRGSGLRVATLDVPKTSPIEGLDGLQLSGWGEHYPLLRSPASLPHEVPKSITDPLRRFVHPPEIVNPPSREWEQQASDDLLAGIDEQREATEALLDAGEWDLLFSVFSSFHYAGHQFFHHMDPDHWAYEEDVPQPLRDAVPDMAAKTDAAIASVFEKFPEDATWFVLSVHGLEPNFSANHLMDRVLQGLGYLVPAEKKQASNAVGRLLAATEWLRTLIPQGIRDRINARLPEGLHDEADSSAFEGDWDWSRTRAFMVPSDHFQALLSLNLAGREPRGIVKPGADADAVMADLARDLLEIENADTGEPAISGVVRTSDVYQGAHLDELPELVVRWAKDSPIRALRHRKFGTVGKESYALRKTQHAPDGFLIAGGRGIRAGVTVKDGRTLDFAPTILRLLGRPIPAELEGRVLEEMLNT